MGVNKFWMQHNSKDFCLRIITGNISHDFDMPSFKLQIMIELPFSVILLGIPSFCYWAFMFNIVFLAFQFLNDVQVYLQVLYKDKDDRLQEERNN